MFRVFCLSAFCLFSSATLAANQVSDKLRQLPLAAQLKVLGSVIGERCTAVDAYYMGIGEEEGYAKDTAFWSARCADGRSFALSIKPDGAGTSEVLECEILKAVANQGCFEPLKQ